MLTPKIRGLLALVMILLWLIVAISGYLIYLTPGPRSGQITIFLLTKREWIDVHFYAAILAGFITILHVVVDRKMLKACLTMLVKR